MFQKVSCVVILLALTLQFSSRVGVLSAVYTHRHEIGYSLGLIDELPIPVCKASYYVSHELFMDDSQAFQEAGIVASQIVNMLPANILVIPDLLDGSAVRTETFYTDQLFSNPGLPFFHPPAVNC